MRHLILGIAFIFAFAIPSKAQFFKYKAGQNEFPVLDEKLKIDNEAVYLYNEGYARIEYVSSKEDFRLVTDHQFCIQILNKDGFEHANIEIPYYVSGATRESVGQIKAYTYNLENGEYVKTKLKSNDIYREEIDLNHRKMKFAMPGVKEGSIIEISYHKESPFYFNFDRWAFQKSIPVVHSLYTVVIPEYFQYNILQRGYEEAFAFKDKTLTVSQPTRSSSGGRITYDAKEYFWEFRNVPPIKKERFSSSIRDFAASIEMELASIKFPHQPIQKFSISWEDFDDRLQEDEFFGQQLRMFPFMADDLEIFRRGRDGSEIPIQEIVAWLHGKVAWNGKFGFRSNNHLRKCYKDGSGNVAAMNFLLIGALRELGYQAYPVLLSTRSHGKVLPGKPRLSAYNYVVTGIERGEEIDLIDASHPYVFPKYLTEYCLNGRYRMQKPEGGKWIEYEIPSTRKNQLVTGKISSEGKITGQSSTSQNGYSALDALEWEEEGQEGESNIIGSCPGEMSYQKLKVEKPSENDPNVKCGYDFTISGLVEESDDLLFFPVGLVDVFEENPFRAEERLYPIDFGYPFQEIQIIELELPEGFKVESLPRSTVVHIPGKKGLFMFQVNQPDDSKIMLIRTFTISQPLFFSEEYASLKQFFDLIIKKENEQIVLKRI